MLDAPLRRCPVAILDFETTWTETSQHPVSVALMHANLGVAGSEVLITHELIKPSVPIRPEATAIHGIDDARVASADPIEEVIGRVLKGLEGRVLCAYNLPFDWQILRDQSEHIGHPNYPQFGFLDPLVWAKVTDKYEKGKKLTDVARRRGIGIARAHDAEADAMMTARVAPLLLRDMKSMKGFDHSVLDTVGSLWAWTVKEALAWERHFAGYCRSKGKPAPSLEYHKLTGTTLAGQKAEQQVALIA